jgi:DNA-binding CsgD family transcriptional regulator
MRRLNIAEDVMRTLVARHPFYEIARMFKCDTRTVGALASRYGLRSAFAAKAATTAEEERIRALRAEGLSVKRIAETLGRSQEFVAKRVWAEAGDDVAERDDDESDEDESEEDESDEDLLLQCEGWPRPDTDHAQALGHRCYEDMSVRILERECPPQRAPLNGGALASAARLANRSTLRSSADLCTEE